MPEERLSRKKLDAILAKQRGEATADDDASTGGGPYVPRGMAPHARHGVTWGIMDDDVDDVQGQAGTTAALEDASNWRELVAKGHVLTERQEKLRERITTREQKMVRSEEELKRLRAKERAGELSETQARAASNIETVRSRDMHIYMCVFLPISLSYDSNRSSLHQYTNAFQIGPGPS